MYKLNQTVLVGIALLLISCSKEEEVAKTSFTIKHKKLNLDSFRVSSAISSTRLYINLNSSRQSYQISRDYRGKLWIEGNLPDSPWTSVFYLDTVFGKISYSDQGVNGDLSSPNGSRIQLVNFK